MFVSTSAKSLPRTPVYKGKASRYTNRRFRNGLYYRYAVVSYDHTGNASGGLPPSCPPASSFVRHATAAAYTPRLVSSGPE